MLITEKGICHGIFFDSTTRNIIVYFQKKTKATKKHGSTMVNVKKKKSWYFTLLLDI